MQGAEMAPTATQLDGGSEAAGGLYDADGEVGGDEGEGGGEKVTKRFDTSVDTARMSACATSK